MRGNTMDNTEYILDWYDALSCSCCHQLCQPKQNGAEGWMVFFLMDVSSCIKTNIFQRVSVIFDNNRLRECHNQTNLIYVIMNLNVWDETILKEFTEYDVAKHATWLGALAEKISSYTAWAIACGYHSKNHCLIITHTVNYLI